MEQPVKVNVFNQCYFDCLLLIVLFMPSFFRFKILLITNSSVPGVLCKKFSKLVEAAKNMNFCYSEI